MAEQSMRDYLEQRELDLEARIAGLEALLCDAQAAIAAEREACAKLADRTADSPPSNNDRHMDWQMGYQDGAMEVASAIRERKPQQ